MRQRDLNVHSPAQIPPASYRFHVIASNNDGVWNEQGATKPQALRVERSCNFFIESVNMILENWCAISTSGSSATAHSCREKRGSTVQFPARLLPARSVPCRADATLSSDRHGGTLPLPARRRSGRSCPTPPAREAACRGDTDATSGRAVDSRGSHRRGRAGCDRCRADRVPPDRRSRYPG